MCLSVLLLILIVIILLILNINNNVSINVMSVSNTMSNVMCRNVCLMSNERNVLMSSNVINNSY